VVAKADDRPTNDGPPANRPANDGPTGNRPADERRLSADELADRSGVTPDRLATIALIGVLRPGPDGRYDPGDIHRVRLIRAFEDSGIPLEALVAAEQAGSISFAYYDKLHVPLGTPSGRRFGDLLASVGPERADLLRRWFGAVGVAEPPLDGPLDLEDEELLRPQATILGDLPDARFGLRVARFQGSAAHRVAEAALSVYAESLAALPVDAAGLPLQETWETYLEPWTRLARHAAATTGWIQGRHLSSAIDAYSVSETERFLERSGYVQEREDEPPAIAFVDIAGFTRLSEERGDDVAAGVASAFADLADRAAAARGGRVVKLLGDGALLRFGDAVAAIDASLDLLTAMPDAGLPPGHAGVAEGPIVARDGDVFGRTVNLAARISDIAVAGELLAPAEVGTRVGGGGYLVSPRGPFRLHGVGEPVDLVDVRRGAQSGT
jgi:adenylate cyclase